MNPAHPTEACPPEAVALQGRGPGRFPGQPGGPNVVQYTTVNIVAEPPSDYVVWSICNFIYGNMFCLGLAAFIFSIKSRDRKVVGDHQGARHYSSTARCLNIWATVLNIIILLFCIILLISVSVQTSRMMHHYYRK
ncbi:dispanin subfamily A member 2b-like [Nematolebias whitei]|uniref:dispanin subfamily A member 2b-like n=1 Tax=Nematolebias whitei TaxID=451745 RepID=UPI0018975275|nr:dispanin subfamily A member 2b-like [Nematolebias whitei]